ncbi:MAG: DUF6883 domain-containing protein [Candidatus Promineifilaceae bacterium]
MQLPNVEQAHVPRTKITDYLLSVAHEDGRSKALFFMRFGFSLPDWDVLARALKQHATDHAVTSVESSPFGKRYIIEGTLIAPDGRTPSIRSIWFIEDEEDIPRLVTAYPLRVK